ncbi:MAG: NADH:ubiquinone reductase (Na(+)-transporting) subunit C [Paludibacteraceae bacterium]|jgi:Na+-transporting NADH:ubiquinone oxidoreductase subunit C|nr:NADH:ubiquinone reductase (Na(+)-transporting) subunit C [Paludibacteraceae bacterium]MED9995497.1 NADH:ubiquinone reductase (Na(+)-transporting) subunit C [Paludibacteraceae bacterium]
MNTNSNTYTIVYASVMVVIVAFLLAFVSSSLKDKQNENVELDKKKQILSALNVDIKGADVAQLYSEIVMAEPLLDYQTGAVKAETGAFDIDSKFENAKPLAERNLPLFVCQIDSATKYVLPVYGAGLWGPIWGYVALDADKSTIFGVYFSHAGETPGLGAEITSAAFKQQFTETPKHITRNGEFTSVAIVKPGKVAEDVDYVNGISGGTITSQGVDAMLKDGLGQYVNFLKQ